MTAIACLRILVAGTAEAGRNIPVSQVEAAADLYLRHRWKAPRRYGAVAPLAFVLADSKAESLDPVEMQTLAVELEAGLFPGREAGQVCLLTFEGDETAVLQFASLSQASLASLIAGRGYAGPPGHVQVITAEEIRAVPSAPSEAVVDETLRPPWTRRSWLRPPVEAAAEVAPTARQGRAKPRRHPPPPSPAAAKAPRSPRRRLRRPPAGGACIIRRRNRSSAP
jgi:hypothetical protein